MAKPQSDPQAASEPERLCVGVIIGARGIRGEVRIKSFTEVPTALADYGPLTTEDGKTVYSVKVLGQAKGAVFARIKGIQDRNGAEALKGTRLHVEAHLLPPPEEDEFYVSDLVGLDAEGPHGTLGAIRSVEDYGAGDVLEIAGGGFGIIMVPFTKACVPVIDFEAGKVVIDPPDGLLDPPDEEAKSREGGEDEEDG